MSLFVQKITETFLCKVFKTKESHW